ncbi:T9SS type A sorting domain-containing protein [Hymenobacter sp. BT683]|uniref:T9SS type A sorting domain-containing protein n=1 Tax=Hymenobacter jeongseonensis TaxID=2791027 RepID=A0ABS0IDT2_9BACT|nr:T9SS type A sorting domain-containing protein [Hymenobacter jeongseonensis]MBF9236519.1 T9SS type A sorting domain-containing protein [Hymenobacter jeongseonensis]
MKAFYTLAALGFLMASSPTASAQFTVDGQATADEIGLTPGKYRPVAVYTGNHLDADRGLKALYVGCTATTLNIMLVGSAESATAGAYRALVLYLNTPGRAGAPAGVQLGGSDSNSPLYHRPTLDMQADYGFRVVVGPGANEAYFSRASYVTGTTTTPGNDTYIGASDKVGTAITAPGTLDLAGSKFAYRNSASLTANTSNSGFEIEIPLAALGTATSPVTLTSRLELFAAFVESSGTFLSEVIPQIANRTTPLGADPDFTAIDDDQYVSFRATDGLASRSAVAAGFDFYVYPNPARATATVAYKVPTGRQAVALAVYNSLGQRVRSLASTQQAGAQKFVLSGLPAGNYLVKLQIGNQTTSRMVVME